MKSGFCFDNAGRRIPSAGAGGRGFGIRRVVRKRATRCRWRIFSGLRPSRPVDLRRRKLVDAVKKVYPIARIAKAKMAAMEEELCRLPTKKAQKAYIRQVYKPNQGGVYAVLKHMTRTQGKVLLKLTANGIPPTRC